MLFLYGTLGFAHGADNAMMKPLRDRKSGLFFQKEATAAQLNKQEPESLPAT
jgi:hypothetical protein